MHSIVSSILVAVITAILSVLGTLYVQKRKNESTVRKNALYLYLNLKQTKYVIDEDKKAIDRAGEQEIMAMGYFSPFDYIYILSELKDKLSEQEIMTVNSFYENVKKLDNKKGYYCNMSNKHSDFLSVNPGFSPYEQQFRNSYDSFVHELNAVTNRDEYKTNIVEIIAKLKRMKDK